MLEVITGLGAAGIGVFVGSKRLNFIDSLKVYAAVLAVILVVSFVYYSSLRYDNQILSVPVIVGFALSAPFWLAKWITDVVVRN